MKTKQQFKLHLWKMENPISFRHTTYRFSPLTFIFPLFLSSSLSLFEEREEMCVLDVSYSTFYNTSF